MNSIFSSSDLAKQMPVINGVTYVPFHPAHLEVIDPVEFRKSSAAQLSDWKKLIAIQAENGVAITAYLHGKPVACFGFLVMWTGVAEMWLLIEERGRQFGKSLTRAAMIVRDCAVLSNNLHRLQITVRCSDTRAVKWAKVLGFDQEAVLRRYGPDQTDFYIFARI
jgi:ribosomal protein S18 acetylase RimI-like enzyme